MSSIVISIDLDGAIVGTKPLLIEDTLASIRQKIQKKVKKDNYIFLDKFGSEIDIEDEESYKLNDISDDKKIKLITSKLNENNLTKIFLNKTVLCSKDCSKINYLSELRDKLKNEIKENFIFLDKNGQDIDIEDENEYPISEALNEGIKIKYEQTTDEGTTNNLSKEAPPVIIEKQLPDKQKVKENAEAKIQNKKPIKQKPKFDFSKYDVLKSEDFESDHLTFYKYSNIKAQEKDNIFQYFYDPYDVNDYKDAYIVLFCGKTGDGKSTAINAFFNIVKGVKLEDKFRFILIKEKDKAGGQSESQTDGVHLYYLKDYNNKPIIIIDSQGYGDTRGIAYDQKINKAFTTVFTDTIDHINAAFFISKATNNRLDILTKYIFSSVTSLFAENISENFIILATFANAQNMKKGPDFLDSLEKDEGADFLNVKQKKENNIEFYYAFDSKLIFDDDINDKLTKYSYEQLSKLYERVKKLFPRATKKCGDVLKSRNELKIQVNNLRTTFKKLILEQNNLKKYENAIIEGDLKIKDSEYKILALKEKSNSLSKEALEEELKRLNEELSKNLDDLNNRKRTEKKREKKADSSTKYTICNECKENCHDPCDCYLNWLTWCRVYPYYGFGDKCERCGHSKRVHQQDYYHYVVIEETVTEDTSSLQKDLKEKNEKEKAKIEERKRIQNSEKNSLKRQLNELEFHKEDLKREKEKNERDRKNVEDQVNKINNNMVIIIMKLQNLSEKLNDIAMNHHHIKNEEEYINSLQDQMKETGLKDEEQEQLMKDIKDGNEYIKKTLTIPKEDLLGLSASELTEKYKDILEKKRE